MTRMRAFAFDAVERGRVPAALLETPIEVHSRVGIDLSPIDVTNPDDVVLLKSFIWPGLDERVARLDAAIETFLATPNRPDADPGRLRRPAARACSPTAPRTGSRSSTRRPRPAT